MTTDDVCVLIPFLPLILMLSKYTIAERDNLKLPDISSPPLYVISHSHVCDASLITQHQRDDPLAYDESI